MLTRYQNHMSSVLTDRHVPTKVAQVILGSLGGALAIARSVGGATGALLAHTARTAFMSGNELSLAVGASVALGGVVLVLVALPSKTADDQADPESDTTVALTNTRKDRRLR